MLLLGVGANAVLSFQPSGDSFYRATFPASQGLFKARIQCALWRPWDVVYTARLSAACPVALSIELLFPPVRDFLFGPSTQYAEAFLGY